MGNDEIDLFDNFEGVDTLSDIGSNCTKHYLGPEAPGWRNAP